MDPTITQEELCQAMKSSGIPFTDILGQLKNLQNFVLNHLSILDPDLDGLGELETRLRTFLHHAIKRYKICSRNFDSFIKSPSNKIFLSNHLVIPQKLLVTIEEEPESSAGKPTQQHNAGRRSLPFEDKSLRAKQAASALVRQSHEPGAINMAAAQQKTPLGKLIRKTNSPSGTTARLALSKIKEKSTPAFKKKTPEEALGFLLVNHLTKKQYMNMKTSCAESQADLWPSYGKVLEAKKQCRPSGITYQELSSSVKLQDLLNHTAQRVLEKNPVIPTLSEGKEKLELVFYFKYGMDGCGSFATFNQKNSAGHVPDGSTLMVSQMVPLQIVCKNRPDLIIYQNQHPNSANSCRPIRIAYERESKESIKTEAERLRAEVANLEPFFFSEDHQIKIHFKGLFTMIDGKVLLELTNCAASSSCPVCHRSYKEISKPQGDFVPREGTLEYGASILHFGLRSFECLCHIGYKQDVKKSRVQRTQAERDLTGCREKEVKAQFLSKLGLVVDRRRDGGAGNTTTGNVARRGFKNAEVTSKICGVPKQLVENLGTLWGALACGYDVDADKFDILCKETEKIYFDPDNGVSWYCMPPTIHKVLKHGADIIRACPIPIGLTNEEAAEANNKFIRRFRLHHARKSSWQEGIQDLFDRLLDVSDPVVRDSVTVSSKNLKSKSPLSPQILALLKAPELPMASLESECSSSDESDDD